MAITIQIHGEYSGSIGDNVWSRNKGGQYIRQRATPTNRNSARQQAVRTILSSLSSGWRGLTTTQRTAWAAWASANPTTNALGMTKQLTGSQTYVGLNSRVVLAGNAAIPTPPTDTAPPGLLTATLLGNTATQLQIGFTATPLPAGARIFALITPPGSVGRDPNQNQARLCQISAAAPASPVALNAPFGLTTGAACNIYVAVLGADGLLSGFQKIRVEALA